MKKTIIKFLSLSVILFLFLSCSNNDVKNKVFTNSNVVIILFNDGTCSYSGILSGTYSYNKKGQILKIDYIDNLGIKKSKEYSYDRNKNCLCDQDKKVYDYKIKASEVKIERR